MEKQREMEAEAIFRKRGIKKKKAPTKEEFFQDELHRVDWEFLRTKEEKHQEYKVKRARVEANMRKHGKGDHSSEGLKCLSPSRVLTRKSTITLSSPSLSPSGSRTKLKRSPTLRQALHELNPTDEQLDEASSLRDADATYAKKSNSKRKKKNLQTLLNKDLVSRNNSKTTLPELNART